MKSFYSTNTKFTKEAAYKKFADSGVIVPWDIKLIERYINDTRANSKNISERRIHKLGIVLTYWRQYLDVPYQQANIDDYLKALNVFKSSKTKKGTDFKKNTQHDYIALLKSFMYYLSEEGVADLPEKRIKKIKTPGIDMNTTKPDKIYTESDIDVLISATNNLKHKALIGYLYETGVRPQECSKCKWSDISFDIVKFKDDKGEDAEQLIANVNIQDTKADTQRYAVLTKYANYLKLYRESQGARADKGDNYVFADKSGGPITYNTMQRTISRIWENSGLNGTKDKSGKHCWLYNFRKSRITNMVKANYNESVIRDQIWANQGTKMFSVYVKLDKETTKNEHLKHAGIKTNNQKIKDDEKPKSITCRKCHLVNLPDNNHCPRCGEPLSEAAKAEADKLKSAGNEYILEQLAALKASNDALQAQVKAMQK